MKNEFRTTGSPLDQREGVIWPTAAQARRQLGVIGIVVVLWGALFAGYLRLTGRPGDEAASMQPEAAEMVSEEPSSVTAASFSEDVLPLLRNRCGQCHGPGRAEGGLAVDGYAALMAGSQTGPVITPGDASSSLLVELIVSGEMPRRGPQMPPAEIEIISAWVNAGALDN